MALLRRLLFLVAVLSPLDKLVSARLLSDDFQRRSLNGDPEEELFSVILKYRNDLGRTSIELGSHSFRQGIGLSRQNSMAAEVTLAELQKLEQDENIERVEENFVMRPFTTGGGEIIPYGLNLIKATSPNTPIPPFQSVSCNDPNVFKVGIVDSGLDVTHPDIPCKPIEDEDTNCIGESFGLRNDDDAWYVDQGAHGTHVVRTHTRTHAHRNGSCPPNAHTHIACLVSLVLTGWNDWCSGWQRYWRERRHERFRRVLYHCQSLWCFWNGIAGFDS